MVTKDNLECLAPQDDRPPLYFVTRLPFSYDEANRVVREAVDKDQWQYIGQTAQTASSKNRPTATYRSHETQVTLYKRSYRALVIHSDAHDKRRQKRINRELNQSRDAHATELAASARTLFHCHADADAELKRLQTIRSLYHRVEGRNEERIFYERGRPRKDGARRVRGRRYAVDGTIEENPEATAQKRAEAGCFVLLGNRPSDGPDSQSAEQLLQSYKAQDGVENNYRFLKDPLIVNDLFLKKPERIEVLGMVLLLCILIWNLMQRTMRLSLQNTKRTVEGWDGRKTSRPTTFMMITKFTRLTVVHAGDVRVVKPKLNNVQRAYLQALHVPDTQSSIAYAQLSVKLNAIILAPFSRDAAC